MLVTSCFMRQTTYNIDEREGCCQSVTHTVRHSRLILVKIELLVTTYSQSMFVHFSHNMTHGVSLCMIVTTMTTYQLNDDR